jgi:hypothetical protein
LVVSEEEYASEAGRVREFLAANGATLVERITATRDRLSADLEFEAAAREHKLLERVEEVLKLRDELARDVDRLHGVAVLRSLTEESVTLIFVRAGMFLPLQTFFLGVIEGRPVSLDLRLKEIAAALSTPKLTLRERQDHLALLARWYYSSWRDGEWLQWDDPVHIPFRKLVNAVHRVAKSGGLS